MPQRNVCGDEISLPHKLQVNLKIESHNLPLKKNHRSYTLVFGPTGNVLDSFGGQVYKMRHYILLL